MPVPPPPTPVLETRHLLTTRVQAQLEKAHVLGLQRARGAALLGAAPVTGDLVQDLPAASAWHSRPPGRGCVSKEGLLHAAPMRSPTPRGCCFSDGLGGAGVCVCETV